MTAKEYKSRQELSFGEEFETTLEQPISILEITSWLEDVRMMHRNEYARKLEGTDVHTRVICLQSTIRHLDAIFIIISLLLYLKTNKIKQ